MKRLLVVIAVFLFSVCPAVGSSRYQPESDPGIEAEQALAQILDLWRDGKYSELYSVSKGGKYTREEFIRFLSAAPFKPACCWEKMQEVSVKLKNDTVALVKAKYGFDGNGGTEFKTRSLKVEKDDGVWRVARADLFSLAEAKKKKKGYRRYRHSGQY